jgi:hypothetical protein
MEETLASDSSLLPIAQRLLANRSGTGPVPVRARSQSLLE